MNVKLYHMKWSYQVLNLILASGLFVKIMIKLFCRKLVNNDFLHNKECNDMTPKSLVPSQKTKKMSMNMTKTASHVSFKMNHATYQQSKSIWNLLTNA